MKIVQHELEPDIRKLLEGFVQAEALNGGMSVDAASLPVLCALEKLALAQRDRIDELSIYRDREIDALGLGDAVSDAICIVSPEGDIQQINRGYVEMTGHTRETVVGKNLRDLIRDGLYERSVSLMAVEQRRKLTMLSTIRQTGRRVLITSTPFFDEAGNLLRVLTVMRDMTELIRLKDELEKAESLSRTYLEQLNHMRERLGDSSALIGDNAEMVRIRELIPHVAKSDVTILITGETGSGKEVVAHEIVRESDRCLKPFVKVNCAAIPEALLESELFGYEKGAFTGALHRGKIGLFGAAEGGTILLDEIGEMPMALQSKLLRVLQDKRITRVGGTTSTRIDVRVIASTNRDLAERVRSGSFREDLYYRLNVVPVRIPPLRERMDDVFLLAYSFLDVFNRKYGKAKRFVEAAIHAMEAHAWPGNVRELENMVERLVVIDDDAEITRDKVLGILGRGEADRIAGPSGNAGTHADGRTTDGRINTDARNIMDAGTTDDPHADGGPSGLETSPRQFSSHAYALDIPFREAVEAFERELIREALESCGSTHRAAKKLGLAQPTLYRRAKALGLRMSDS